jgi:hypothetical protein
MITIINNRDTGKASLETNLFMLRAAKVAESQRSSHNAGHYASTATSQSNEAFQ